jgi:predicted metalloprotease
MVLANVPAPIRQDRSTHSGLGEWTGLGQVRHVQENGGDPMRLKRFNPANIRVRGGGTGGASATEICEQNSYSLESCSALSSLNETWKPLFRKGNIYFEQPTLDFYVGGTRSGCSAVSSEVGPFYCPADQGIYIGTSFYDQMARQLGASSDFARYYVIAHEFGHHVQKLTGLADQVRSAQQQNPRRSNALQVLMELQADCCAGVWAGRNRTLIEPGDIAEGLTAAGAIDDDSLQRSADKRVSLKNFTHGSSAQRMDWLRRGLETGNDDACGTFAGLRR